MSAGGQGGTQPVGTKQGIVIAAGLGYIVDGCGKLLLPDYSLTVGAYTFVWRSATDVLAPLEGHQGN